MEVQYVFRNKQTNGLSVLDCISVYLKEDDREGQSDSVSNQLPCSVISPKSGGSTYRSAVTVNDGAKAIDGQGFLRSCIEKDRSALIVSAGKTHKIKSGCLLNVTEIRTSEIEARAIR